MGPLLLRVEHVGSTPVPGKLRVADEVRWDKRACSEAKGPSVVRLLREHGIRP